MNPSAPQARITPGHPATDASWWLMLALAALPLGQLVPVDPDSFLPLLLLPAIAAGLKTSRIGAGASLAQARWLWILTGLAVIASTVFSDHAARASVTSAAWALAIAGGFTARNLAGSTTNIQRILTGVSVGALLGFVLVRALVADGSINLPLYGHPRVLGMHMLTGTFAALALLASGKPKSRVAGITLLAVSGAVSGGLWWTGGRAPILGTVIGLSLWLWRSPVAERAKLLKALVIVGVLAGIVAFSSGAPSSGTGWKYPFARTIAATNLSELSSTRTEIWDVSSGIGDSPWIGHGADSYLFIRPRQIGDQPHNALIQWMLDFGFLGTLPLVLLLGATIFHGLRSRAAVSYWNRAAAAGLGASAVVGLFDGMFYHAVLIIPVVILGGIALAPVTGSTQAAAQEASRWLWPSRIFIGACAGLLALHHWLAIQLAYARPPAPDGVSARVLKVFPSTTFPLVRWLEHWQKTDPELALAWSHWAESHAISPALFHVFNARYYAQRNRLPEAEAELKSAIAKCRRSDLKQFEQELVRFHQREAPYASPANH